MIVYYTPPAISSASMAAARPAIEQPGGPMIRLHVAPVAKPATVKPNMRGTEKGRPPQTWLQASGFPSGVLTADNQWHPNKWVGGGKAPLYKAVKAITGLPVVLGVGVAGDTQVHWLMQSRLTCLYRIAQESGVMIEIMPHNVRIVSG
jgi:hypothetical protein